MMMDEEDDHACDAHETQAQEMTTHNIPTSTSNFLPAYHDPPAQYPPIARDFMSMGKEELHQSLTEVLLDFRAFKAQKKDMDIDSVHQDYLATRLNASSPVGGRLATHLQG